MRAVTQEENDKVETLILNKTMQDIKKMISEQFIFLFLFGCSQEKNKRKERNINKYYYYYYYYYYFFL